MKNQLFIASLRDNGQMKLFSRYLTSLLIYCISMLPLVHFHPVIQHYENDGVHSQQGKVDILSFSDAEETSPDGYPLVSSEATDTPEVRLIFETKRNEKLDFFFGVASLVEIWRQDSPFFLPNEELFSASSTNHYRFRSTLSPPLSLV